MIQHLLGRGSIFGHPFEHGKKEVRKHVRLLVLDSVFVLEKLFQRDVLQTMNSLETVLTSKWVIFKEFGELFSCKGEALRHGAKQFNHLCQMII